MKDRWRGTEGDLEEHCRERGEGMTGLGNGEEVRTGMSDTRRMRPSGEKNDERTRGGMRESDAGRKETERGEIRGEAGCHKVCKEAFTVPVSPPDLS